MGIEKWPLFLFIFFLHFFNAAEAQDSTAFPQAHIFRFKVAVGLFTAELTSINCDLNVTESMYIRVKPPRKLPSLYSADEIYCCRPKVILYGQQPDKAR
ncbi:hypothetical protein TcasGA2_TC033697 [Tribolium castaneum]|uniref:Uncharacterized protein n=1 Tax=Tribolium castaneum TaxID=7070 RepID=A0A139WEK2_TRICA|nr:hypothetical protein TcasGA2_TC033697 [Tribolium castaneum]